MKRHIHIQAISSDIGYHLAKFWLKQGHTVTGTYRTRNTNVEQLVDQGIEVTDCDLSFPGSVDAAGRWLSDQLRWNVLVLAAGSLEPIGLFADSDIDEWELSICNNFVGQFRYLHRALPQRDLEVSHSPVVLFFAGSGTNSAPVRYSSYIVSKIAAIKMCELLHAELPDTTFTILGPGWVNTKIHQSTLRAGSERSGNNYFRTIEMLKSDSPIPIERVLECCDWLINARREIVGGRNFSAVHDPWDSDLINLIESNPDAFRLRRSDNDRFG